MDKIDSYERAAEIFDELKDWAECQIHKDVPVRAIHAYFNGRIAEIVDEDIVERFVITTSEDDGTVTQVFMHLVVSKEARRMDYRFGVSKDPQDDLVWTDINWK